jgi:hypothetical protein
MAKLKKAPGRVIGRWKQEAISANPGASDSDLANIINDMAKKQGYAYTITPEKVRSKKGKKKRRARRTAPAAVSTAPITAAPAPKKAASTGGISLEDIRSVKGLVGRIGADKVQELAGMWSQ